MRACVYMYIYIHVWAQLQAAEESHDDEPKHDQSDVSPEEETLIQRDELDEPSKKNSSSIAGASFNYMNSIIGSGMIGVCKTIDF